MTFASQANDGCIRQRQLHDAHASGDICASAKRYNRQPLIGNSLARLFLITVDGNVKIEAPQQTPQIMRCGHASTGIATRLLKTITNSAARTCQQAAMGGHKKLPQIVGRGDRQR